MVGFAVEGATRREMIGPERAKMKRCANALNGWKFSKQQVSEQLTGSIYGRIGDNPVKL